VAAMCLRYWEMLNDDDESVVGSLRMGDER
jgi:hypothetical protein